MAVPARRRLTAADLRRMRARAARTDWMPGTSAMSRGPSGSSLSPGDSTGTGDGFWALLAGNGPIYAFVEQTPTDAPGFTPTPRGRRGSVLEVKGVAGLAGRYAWIYPENVSYRLDYPRFRSTTGVYTLSSVKLNVVPECCPAPTATLTLTTPDGTVVGTCTSSTTCTIDTSLPAGTVLDYTITAPPYPPRSGFITLGGPFGLVTLDASYTLLDLIPRTLHVAVTGPPALVGAGGTYAVNYNASRSTGSAYVWDTGCLPGQGGWGVCQAPYFYHCDEGGGVSATIGADRIARAYYVATRISVIQAKGSSFDPPACSVQVAYENFWNSNCPDSPGGDPPPICYVAGGIPPTPPRNVTASPMGKLDTLACICTGGLTVVGGDPGGIEPVGSLGMYYGSKSVSCFVTDDGDPYTTGDPSPMCEVPVYHRGSALLSDIDGHTYNMCDGTAVALHFAALVTP